MRIFSSPPSAMDETANEPETVCVTFPPLRSVRVASIIGLYVSMSPTGVSDSTSSVSRTSARAFTDIHGRASALHVQSPPGLSMSMLACSQSPSPSPRTSERMSRGENSSFPAAILDAMQ